MPTRPARPKRTTTTPPVAGELASIEALTHGIFAITMTLMILELRVPETESDGHLWESLKDLAPNVAGYLFGFVYLMSVWLSIRHLFRQMKGITNSVSILLLVTVGLVSLTPFTVSTMGTAIGSSDDLGTAVRLMAAVVGTSFVLSAVAAKVALRQGLVPATPWFKMPWPRAVLSSAGPAALGFALSYVQPWLGIAVLSVDIVLGIVYSDPGKVEHAGPEGVAAAQYQP
jgi:uncharacterized membrane protein